MEIIMNYRYAKSIVEEDGWDEFFDFISNSYKEFVLYQCSWAWFESDEYICKFKGEKGDLIIRWEHKMVS